MARRFVAMMGNQWRQQYLHNDFWWDAVSQQLVQSGSNFKQPGKETDRDSVGQGLQLLTRPLVSVASLTSEGSAD